MMHRPTPLSAHGHGHDPIADQHGGAGQPVINIQGDTVALGPLRRDLIPTYHRWHNDIATTRTFALFQPTTLEQEEASYAQLTTAPQMAFFTVYERASS